MARLTRSLAVGDRTPDDCFRAAMTALIQHGFHIWKTRPIGWLVIAQRGSAQGDLKATVTARPGAATTVTLSLEGASLTDHELEATAQTLFEALKDALV